MNLWKNTRYSVVTYYPDYLQQLKLHSTYNIPNTIIFYIAIGSKNIIAG